MALPHEGVIKVSGVRKKIQIFLSGLACKPSETQMAPTLSTSINVSDFIKQIEWP